MRSFTFRAALASATAAALSPFALADIAFNNFGAGDTFDTTTGWTASGPTSAAGGQYRSACQFTSATSGILDKITIAIGHVSGTNSASVTMYYDAGDVLGAMFTSWYTSGLPAFGGSYSPQVLINGFPFITLTAGTKYWVEVSPGASDTWAAWNYNNQGDLGRRASSTDGGSTYAYFADNTRGAMRVETIVPEPASLVALGLGAAAALRRRRR